MTSSRDRLLMVREAAEVLGVAPNTVRAWADAGKLPCARHPMNNYRLFRLRDLTKILDAFELDRREG